MSLPVRNLKCLSPVMCQCKVICSNRTLSLMFGCKVRSGTEWTARTVSFLQIYKKKINKTEALEGIARL